MLKKIGFIALLVSSLFSVASLAEDKKSVSRVGLLVSLPEEIDEVAKKLQNSQKEFFRGQSFLVGTLEGYPVVAAAAGIGKVAAASAAQRLISEYGAQFVLSTGVAAGTNSQFEIGDVVVPTHAFQHDYGWLTDALTLQRAGALPNLSAPEAPLEAIFPSWDRMNVRENQMIDGVRAVLKNLVRDLQPVEVGGKMQRPFAHLGGTIATGDQFVASDAKKKEIKALGGDLVDMQGGAIAQVALRNAVPCLLIRTVSDKMGASSVVDAEKFVGAAAKNNLKAAQSILSSRDFKDYLAAAKLLSN